jgi:hypothetical protein
MIRRLLSTKLAFLFILTLSFVTFDLDQQEALAAPKKEVCWTLYEKADFKGKNYSGCAYRTDFGNYRYKNSSTSLDNTVSSVKMNCKNITRSQQSNYGIILYENEGYNNDQPGKTYRLNCGSSNKNLALNSMNDKASSLLARKFN